MFLTGTSPGILTYDIGPPPVISTNNGTEIFSSDVGGLQPISRDTDNNAAMCNCWWTNKRS